MIHATHLSGLYENSSEGHRCGLNGQSDVYIHCHEAAVHLILEDTKHDWAVIRDTVHS